MTRVVSALLPLCALLLLAGCQSSDNPTKPLTPGNNSDPNYQFVSEEVVNDHSFQGIDLSLDLSGSLVDSIPGAATVRGLHGALPAIDGGELVIESCSYTLQGTWHVFQVAGYVARFSPVDTLDLVGVDSIQLLANESPLLYPDSTMDGFDSKLRFQLWSRLDGDSLAGSHHVQIRLVDAAAINVNAALAEYIRFQHSDSEKTCDVAVANNLQATNVVIDILGGGCPQSGTIAMTTAISIDCQGTGGGFSTSVDGVWTVHAVFDGVTEEYTVTNGSTVWTHSQPCGGAAAISFTR